MPGVRRIASQLAFAAVQACVLVSLSTSLLCGMNGTEAKSILEQELSRYRGRSYSELLSMVDHSETFERASPSGVTYQIEVQIFFDDEQKRALRILGAIDHGGWRAFKPWTDDFIMAPDGSLVGE